MEEGANDGTRCSKNSYSEDLDTAFSCSKWSKQKLSPDEVVEDFIKRCDEESVKFLSEGAFQPQLNLKYGSQDREKIDVFLPKSAGVDAPIFMFLHGGYWQAEELSKDNNSFLGAPLIKNGAVFVTVGYSLAPECTLHDMVEQVKKVVVFVARRFPHTRGVFISGHSAGGHLAAMMLSVDWSSLLQDKKNVIKGILPISGIFDVRLITKTYINEPLSLTESSAASVSPHLLVDAIPECNLGVKVHLLFTEYDPPILKQQAQDYSKLLSSYGLDVEMTMLPEKDHFQELIELTNENCLFQKVFLRMMGLTS
ncbi:kynurenine formamidase-like isoform X2 [Lytechinus pictus]|uniref:kynurenine formamidase-like isoform X2 n=1 Tax=Lytechinus pictus TaxID=7653 RepID=UPI0030B9EBBF